MKRERQPQSNAILWKIDDIKINFAKNSKLNPKLLLTENRKDIELRIRFLEDVFVEKINPEKTKYYRFISDKDKGIGRDAKQAIENFKKLLIDIRGKDIKEPLLVAQFTKKIIKTRYIIKEKKYWSEIENKTGYQLMDGAHRLSIAIFLKFNSIPVKIIKPSGFEVPNYSTYIQHKEKEYL